jgi:hypothetical protein
VTNEGLFEAWINPLKDGLYAAEVVSVVHDTYVWNQTLDPVLENDTDTNENDFPEQWYLVGATAAALLPDTINRLMQGAGDNPIIGWTAGQSETIARLSVVPLQDLPATGVMPWSSITPRSLEDSALDRAIEQFEFDPFDVEFLEELVVLF